MTVRRAWERIWADYTGTEAASDRGNGRPMRRWGMRFTGLGGRHIRENKVRTGHTDAVGNLLY